MGKNNYGWQVTSSYDAIVPESQENAQDVYKPKKINKMENAITNTELQRRIYEIEKPIHELHTHKPTQKDGILYKFNKYIPVITVAHSGRITGKSCSTLEQAKLMREAMLKVQEYYTQDKK
jgi:hypothetical protein